MDYPEALAFLDGHVNLERAATRRAAPTLDRIRALLDVLAEPQTAYPVLTVTGTNGKGSVARMLTGLLGAHGLTVGTYTSPHLQRVNERLSVGGVPIGDDAFAALVRDLAGAEMLAGVDASWFELVTAGAFRWFADLPVDVAVVEVGMLGRWDATNTADARVAGITNVGWDHADYAGPSLGAIAAEKAGVIKPGAAVCVGETEPDLAEVFVAEAARVGAGPVWHREVDFDCLANVVAVGGRMLTLTTPGAVYEDLYVPLHGWFQGDNAALALAMSEAFFGRPSGPEVVAAGLADVSVPGRLEVVGRHPLVVLDGAHNPPGAAAAAAAVEEDFAGVEDRVLCVGMLAGRDPVALLDALDVTAARLVVACAPDTPRALPAAEVAEAAASLGTPAVVVPDVARAVERAVHETPADGLCLICGSLYVVGAARTVLLGPP